MGCWNLKIANKLATIRRRWGKWRQLTGTQRRLFLQALALLPWVRLMLRFAGFRRLYEMPVAAPRKWVSEAGPDAHAIALLVNRAAAVGPLNATCLHRSLVLSRLLRRQGIANALRIGVRQDETGFAAHAWVEVDGVPLNDEPEVHRRFSAFDDGFFSPRGATGTAKRLDTLSEG